METNDHREPFWIECGATILLGETLGLFELGAVMATVAIYDAARFHGASLPPLPPVPGLLEQVGIGLGISVVNVAITMAVYDHFVRPHLAIELYGEEPVE